MFIRIKSCRSLARLVEVKEMYLFKFVLFAFFAQTFGEKARFDNYRVYSINIQNENQLEVLQGLESSQDGISYIEAPITVKRAAEMIVPPHKYADISEFFEKFGIEHEIKIDNLQRSGDMNKICGTIEI